VLRVAAPAAPPAAPGAAPPPQASSESPRVPPEPVRPQAVANQPNAVPAPSSELNCKSDEERLAKLRVKPVAEDIAHFERELSCAKLRPQIVRLRESIAGGEPKPKSSPAPPVAESKGNVEQSRSINPATPSSPEICKRDEERLARLRANPTPDEIARFERELGCTRLRPQVVRLRESLGAN